MIPRERRLKMDQAHTSELRGWLIAVLSSTSATQVCGGMGSAVENGMAKPYVQRNLILSNTRPVMAKASVSKPTVRGAKQLAGSPLKGGPGRTRVAQRDWKTGQLPVSKARFEAVMQAAQRSGLLIEKSGRIGGRVSPALVKQAKRQTGIETDTDLIEFALATVALEDNFADVFRASRGKVDAKLKLGF
jgi:hypothetical protein